MHEGDCEILTDFTIGKLQAEQVQRNPCDHRLRFEIEIRTGTRCMKILIFFYLKVPLQMPKQFYDFSSRVDHIFSALLPGSIDKLNISDRFDLSVKFPTDENEATSISINDVSTSVPLSYELNHGNVDQTYVDYGITSICSLYKNNLNTFVQKPVKLTEAMKQENSLHDELLLVAECSDSPRLAIFIGFKNNSNEFSHIKVYTAGNYFTMSADGEPVISFNGEQHNIKESSFEYPQFQSDFKWVELWNCAFTIVNYTIVHSRVSLKDESIIEVENYLIESKIQYMKNLITVSLPTVMKGKLCGLCNLHKNLICWFDNIQYSYFI